MGCTLKIVESLAIYLKFIGFSYFAVWSAHLKNIDAAIKFSELKTYTLTIYRDISYLPA